MLSFNLAGEAKQLLEEEVWQHTGRNAKTLIKEADLRVVLVALRRGMSMDAHQTAGPVLIQAISGRLRVNLPDQHINLAPSQCVALEAKVQHSVTAGEDSIFLLTIAWPGHSAISQP
jgi:quercetin dioxygenase-like cupin family protein